MFKEFLSRYNQSLVCPKKCIHKHSRYTIFDTEYISFIRQIMKYIEPRFEIAGSYIIKELQEYLEVVFFIEGTYKVGYTLNTREIFVMPYNSR